MVNLIRHERLKIWTAGILLLAITAVRALQPEECAAESRKITVNPDADAFIGVVLPIRSQGTGLLGCGAPSQDGVELLEALKWAGQVMNHAEETEGEQSFIPGVKLGFQVWDTCGHSASLPYALSELLPVLRDGPAFCSRSLVEPQLGNETSAAPLFVGLVDGAGATRDPDIRAVLADNNVPALVLQPDTLVAAEDRAKALISMAVELQWRQVAFIFGDDDYGTRMYRSAVRLAADSDLCVVAAERLNDLDHRSAASALMTVQAAAAAASATARGSNVTGVLVMARRTHFMPLLDAVRHLESPHLQWLFSDLLAEQDVSKGLTSEKFYSLTLAPPTMPRFEKFWASQIQNATASSENFVQLFEMQKRGCRLSGWTGPKVEGLPICGDDIELDAPDSLGAALRGRNSAAALHVVYTLAHALKSAWTETCQEPGVCPELRSIDRQQFNARHLAAVEVDYSVPQGRMVGLPKTRLGDPSEMSASSLTLMKYQRGKDARKLRKLFEYTFGGPEAPNPDRGHRSAFNRVDFCSEPDDPTQCPRCLRLREARTRDRTAPRSLNPSNRPPAHHTISSPQHVYIAGIFSVHQAPFPGAPLLGECGALEVKSARQVEAFTWALKRVNEKYLSPVNIKLGAVLLDACHSSGRALALPATLLGEGAEPILAAVNALHENEAHLASSVFRAMNITSISTDAFKSGHDAFEMQIRPSAEIYGSALKETLKELEWDYVSVVRSADNKGAEAAVKILREASVCIATEEILTSESNFIETVAKLVLMRRNGAKGVILWVKPEDAMKIIKEVGKSGETKKENELFWMVVDEHSNPELQKTILETSGSAFIFSPMQNEAKEFEQHLRLLRDEDVAKTTDNPWLEVYYSKALRACADNDTACDQQQRTLQLQGSADNARIIQAVYAVGASIARARRELCPDLPAGLPGLCPPGGNRPDMKQTVNSYLHTTPSESAGGAGDEFRFTARGAGDVPVEIHQLRKRQGGAANKSAVLEKVASISQSTADTKNLQLLSQNYGSPSRCASDCSSCRKPSSRFVLTHPSNPENKPHFYVGVNLGMHAQSASNPLECGGAISRRGVQNMEALLWALDRFNANNSVHLSAVVMDSCGSRMRTSRDVALLLEQKDEVQAERIVTMITNDGAQVAESTANLAAPFSIPVIGSEAPFHKQHSPYPLQLNAGLKMRIQTVMRLIRKLGWDSISVVTTEDASESEAMLKLAQFEAKKQSVTIMNTVTLPDIRDNLVVEVFKNTIMEVRDVARDSGVRAVLVLLPPSQLEQLFMASRSLHQEGEVVPGELVFLGIKHEEIFQKYSDQTMGSLVLQPKVGWVQEFEQYFRSLKENNDRNPWFREFWSSVFSCSGQNCNGNLELPTFKMEQDPAVIAILNSVTAVSHALDTVERDLCSEVGPRCLAIQDAKLVRSRLFEVMPHMAFVGAGMSGVAFSTVAGDNLGASLHVLNVRRIGTNVFGLVPVGITTRSGDLQLNRNTMKAYAKDLTEVPYTEISSKCADCGVKDQKADYMEVSPGNKVTILSFSSIHSASPDQSSNCGPLKSMDSFQRAAALAFAIEKVNSNPNFTGISGLHFDDCSNPSRAIYQTYGYLAEKTAESELIVSSPKTVAVALLADNKPNEGLELMLGSQSIPLTRTEDSQAIMKARLHAAVSIGQELGWSRMTIIRKEGSLWGKTAAEMLISEIFPTIKTMCVGEDLDLNVDQKDLRRDFQLDLNTPFILLFENAEETQKMLNVLSESKKRNRILIASGWDDSISYNGSAEIFAIGRDLSTENVPGFREFVTSAVTSSPGYIPASWAAEYVEAAANGAKWKQAYGVSEIIKIVELLSTEVQRLCTQDKGLPLCGQDSKGFREEVQATLTAHLSSTAPNLAVWRMNGSRLFEKVGGWKRKGGLSVTARKWKKAVNATNECESFRIGRSGKLTSVIDEVPNPPAIIGELREMWGLVTASISILGALVAVAFVVYFASATEKAVGTSVLGYQILFGVLILYLSNLTFLIAPSEIGCFLRRLVPSLSYAIILSGMLIKVVTIWRYQDNPKADLEIDPLSRPCGLLCCSFSLIMVQAFLSGGWILLVPAGAAPPTSFGGSWTCMAASSKEILSSLSYVATLILLTIMVSFKARRHPEARNILVCCIFLAFGAGMWTAAANSVTLAALHKDCMAGVVAGLVVATLVLITIFIPKLAQHSRLSKDKKIQQIQHATMRAHKNMQPVMYGVPQYSNPSPNSSSRSVVIKAFPDVDDMVGVEHVLGSEASIQDDSTEPELANLRADHEELEAHSPALELPTSEALYPIDMYTGPPATTSTFGHGAPPPPPMPRISLVDHYLPGSNEFTALPPPPASLLGSSSDEEDYSRHEGISYI
ncbi:uncharacterized protein LOC132205474 isoform X2 [Neocloeon triangulifer]|uniref:uncharacterized protein LOC132205474 isoform X2 n=1 Tax=Neocloeon triangulifer TaxID=2078957 RepID=UPI00286EEC8F|nr:uncharacterized protein LOC132205474 isoform X2 [Neocloeon triangulifer]